jgi:Protein of unknown function (DUF2844)
MNFRRMVPSALLCLGLISPPASWASLGGTLDSVRTDGTRMHATRHVASRNACEVHELTLASGTLVREFTTTSNTVFGVAWQGPFKPDLQQLLGAHFPRLVAAGQVPHGDHRSLRIHSSDLVIESSGRMRAFAGRAYLPDLVPAGMSLSDIR